MAVWAMTRARRTLRRSRSLMPPQMPNFSLLAIANFKAVAAHHAASANLLGLPGRCAPLWEEQFRIDAHAVSTTLPGPVESTFEQCLECHLGRPLP